MNSTRGGLLKKYRAGVIGCGRIGAQENLYSPAVRPATHAAGLDGNPRTRLIGLVDTDSRKLQAAGRLFAEAALFNSADEFFEKLKPEIVVIAAPTTAHYQLVKLAAFHKTKAIICEKPISQTIKQAEEMIKVCRQAGSLLFINHNRRFDYLFKQARQTINQGQLGRIAQATGYYYNGLFNNGSHLVDILRFLLGEADWLIGFENERNKGFKQAGDLNVDGLIYFKNDVMAALQSLPQNYGFFELYLYGTKGSLFFRNLGCRLEQRELEENKHYQGYYQLGPAKTYGQPRSFIAPMIEHIVSCLDGESQPVSQGEDGLSALKILFGLEKSAQNNGKVIKL